MAELKREMGFWAIFALAMGALVGSGLFFGSAIGAGYSGNMSVFAWVIMGTLSVYVSSLFGELVAMFPKAGGAYEFSKQTYGRFFSFMIGWLVWFVANIQITMLIIVALDYLVSPSAPYYGILRIAISIAFILLINYIAYIGIEASAVTLLIFAGITVAVALSVIFPGFFHITLSNFSPFFTHQPLMIFVTMFFIAETFFGWEAATFLAEETKEPEKVIPKALVWASAVMAFLGILLTFTSLGIIPWKELALTSAPLGKLSQIMFGDLGSSIVSLGVYFTMIGSAAVGIISTPRLIFALARDRLFLSQMAKIHPVHKTPYKAIIFQTVVSIIVLFLCMGRYKVFLSLLVPLSIMMYIPIILSVTILRVKKPFTERKFKAPFARSGPIIICLFLVAIIIAWLFKEPNAPNLFLLGLSLTALGIPIYFLLQLYYNPKAIVVVNDFFAYLALFTEKYLFPIPVRDEIVRLLGSIKNKTVLEFGCGVGTFTNSVAEAVSRNGRVYATDISEREIRITRGRMKKAGYEHVIVLHEKKDTLHENVKRIDAAFSIAALGYIQDVKCVLREINSRLKKGGRIVFLEYDRFFYIIPNIDWLSHDSEIEHIFSECGFSVKIERKQGIFWQYIYIYGSKVKTVKNQGIMELKEETE
jgi:APA family basic amino acid/polyamine antiporter